MDKLDFIPIILGSDSNAYGMARSFYEEYQVSSIALGKGQLPPTQNSNIISVEVYKDLDKPDVFQNTLIQKAKELKSKADKLILIASSDNYAELIIRNKEVLEQYYIVPFVSEELMDQLIYKENFYEVCEKYNIDYPKTLICTPEDKDNIEPSFEFPVVIKASDSLSYAVCNFKGKKKAYIVNDKEEFRDVIDKIYLSGYNGNLIIQEYIPGDDSEMRVLNCYSGKDQKVKMMCLGRVLLEDCTPLLVGNYVGIINEYNQHIYNKYKAFLEEIGFEGFANFDMKYDRRDGKYKLFEMNLRQGRSSYFVTGSGYNLARYLVEDRVYNKEQEIVFADNEHLWLSVSKGLLLKYLNDKSLQSEVKKLIKQNKYCSTLDYKEDFNMKRFIKNLSYNYEYYKRFKRYYEKKY
ncbi:ATP-grasp domain-containing protein [Natranaerobius trueperi]|uniref:ATP-grasp domain-containing protein n=1 Tax=Natranaerobius trueperi TaxID=759412 RepID=A0A226C255_9FIRM|nr:ATP-grasp domain-containing protein [Natranaerobius trueperi]OWZ84674.1 ATP-grasp domain-containing protein [Natranaerobius trueperi]